MIHIRNAVRLAGCVAAVLTALPTTAASPAFERALESMEASHYLEARQYLQSAAEQGDRDAQRSLGLMMLYGETLYGKEIPADIQQARRWLQTASKQGCEVSYHMLKTMDARGRSTPRTPAPTASAP